VFSLADIGSDAHELNELEAGLLGIHQIQELNWLYKENLIRIDPIAPMTARARVSHC
jgi:hypothetical protein